MRVLLIVALWLGIAVLTALVIGRAADRRDRHP